MDNFPGNSKKASEALAKPEKVVEKVIKGEVVVKKKSFGSKLHDLFIGDDSRSAMTYVATEVLIPAFRNLIVDATTKGIERIIYGDASPRRPSNYQQGHIRYDSPSTRYNPRPPQEAGRGPSPRRQGVPRYEVSDLIFTTRDEADTVIEMLNEIIKNFDFATVSDLHELAGLPSSHTDNKWGWSSLRYAQTKQVREGFLIDFPPLEPN